MTKQLKFRDFSMVIALILIWAFFSIKNSLFLGPRNLSMLAIEVSITATLALGMLLVLIPGKIDLSVGSGVGLIGGIAAVLVFHHNVPAMLAMLAAIAIALILWWLMGLLIVKQNMPPFIITLGGMLVFKGLFWLVIKNATVPVMKGNAPNIYSFLTTYFLSPWIGYLIFAIVAAGILITNVASRKSKIKYGFEVDLPEVFWLKTIIAIQIVLLLVVTLNNFRGIPLCLLILGGVALLVSIVTQRTRFGRYLYAVGGNEEAARLSGINVDKVVIGAFALLGFIVALTGLMQTAYAGASTTTVGDLMEMDAIAACVIGGTSLMGGRGTVVGVLFGALIMASLLNGMTLLAVSPETKYVARGVALVLAVWMDVYLNRKKS